jgi:NhaP-type Na+/H+ or K+/H+ antiporter
VIVETEAEVSDHSFTLTLIIILFMITLYMLIDGIKHERKVIFGHEASFVTLFGIVISGAEMVSESSVALMSFNQEFFFYAVMPFIVFASGFNMYRSNFFGNIRNIMLFGIVTTVVCFVFFATCTLLYAKNFTLTQTKWDTSTNTW